MKWLSLIGSSVYAYIAIIISILLAFIGYQKKELKAAQKEAELAQHNANELIKAREVVKEIDERKLNNEKVAAELNAQQAKDFGEITNELDQMDTDNLIVKLSGMLNDRKTEKRRSSR